VSKSFWESSILNWEKLRYESFLSNLFFSSLNYRKEYLAYVVDQFPKGSTVVEIGCGSGYLYQLLTNKGNIQYIGYDISYEAISLAKEKFKNEKSATWICDTIDNINNLQADYVISAGLLDWISDDSIRRFLLNNRVPYQIHSFSQDKKSILNLVHKYFSSFISSKDKIPYKPRKFNLKKIQELFPNFTDLKIITDKKLSFGAFVSTLPNNISDDFRSFKIYNYFNKKQIELSITEKILKPIEVSIVKKSIENLENRKILEVGTGAGLYSKWILDYKISSLTGLDPSVNANKYIHNPNFHFYKTTLENFKSDEKFDIIFVLGVLEFVNNLPIFFEKLLNLTHSNSIIYLLIPKPGLIKSFYNLFHSSKGVRLNSNIEEHLLTFLKENNYKIVYKKFNCGLLNNLILVKRHE
jgi:2-polyprenyl-3-methyl-5-hydroxy-6-metoxy-1,4-benzoquinol methylase